MLWSKSRNNTYDHRVLDSVRGASTGNKALATNQSVGESICNMGVVFNIDGFSLDTDVGTCDEPNSSDGGSYADWLWKKSSTA